MFNLQLFLTFVVTLFVVLNPIGTVPIFMGETARFNGKQVRRIALKAVFFAFIIIVTFALAGNAILRFLAIDISAIQITGGVVLFLIALQLLLGITLGGPKKSTTDSDSEQIQDDIAVVPFAFPLLAGPGTIVTVITKVQSSTHTLDNWLSMLAAVLVVLFVVLILFSLSKPIGNLLGVAGVDFFTKIFGMLLAAIAIQMIGDGVFAFIGTLKP